MSLPPVPENVSHGNPDHECTISPPPGTAPCPKKIHLFPSAPLVRHYFPSIIKCIIRSINLCDMLCCTMILMARKSSKITKIVYK